VHIVTDTHPWVWFLTANPRLSSKAKGALADPSNLIIVSSIVLMVFFFFAPSILT
jgi:PIN domain nuclease of toxin-antitoxin system